MSSQENKEALKIFCSQCNQKLDVTEFKSFSKFPCPVCKNEIGVPKKIGEYLLTEKLPVDEHFENYTGLKGDKKTSIKIFKKKLEDSSTIKTCIKMLSSEHTDYEFSELNGQVIGVCKKLTPLEDEVSSSKTVKKINLDENKKLLKIFCSECKQKLDVSESESFSKFPCPVCKKDNIVPKKIGEHYLIEKLSDDEQFENYIELKDDKEVSVKIFKKKIEGSLGIKACLKMLSKENSSYNFAEENGQLIGICEDIKVIEEEKKSSKAKEKNQKKETEKAKKSSSKKGLDKSKKKSPSKAKNLALAPKSDLSTAPVKAIKVKLHSKSNNSAFVILGIIAALIALVFVIMPNSSQSEKNADSSNLASLDNKKSQEEKKAQKELEKKQEAARLQEEKKQQEIARLKEEEQLKEMAKLEAEQKQKELAKQKEEMKQKELEEFLALIKPSEEQRQKFAQLPEVSSIHFQKLMNKHCIDCHNVKKRKGDLDASMFTTPASIYISFERIKDMYESVKSGEMPPEDEEISDSDKNHLLAYLEKIIFTLESKPAKVPSTAMVRRFTPYEFDYTVQDVTGLDLEFAESFPAESSGDQGFVNDASQLNVSPIMMEKYMSAAESIASHSEFDIIKGFTFSEKPSPLLRPEKLEENLQSQMYAYLKEYYPSDFAIQQYLPRLINACAELTKDTSNKKSLEDLASKHKIHPLFVQNGLKYFSSLSGKSKTETAILRNWSGLRSSKDTKDLLKEITEQLMTAYAASSTVLNNHQNKERHKHIALVKNIESLFLVDKEALGTNVDESKWQEYSKIADIYQFSRFATNVRQGAAVQAHLKPLIYKFLYKMYRRPPSEQELAIRVNDVLNDTLKVGMPLATRILVIREFCSFNFFFRIEHKKESKIDDYDLASRLSYFLWAGPPDEELLKLASEKKLSDEETMNQQITRMLKDKKSARLAKHFAEQWLRLNEIMLSDGPEKDIFPGFDKDLAKDMWMETAMCFNYIVKNDRSMLELLSSDYTIINNRLSDIYGLNQHSSQFKKVYVKNEQRGGIVGHASILTMTSFGKRTSPINRGSWVLGVLLGTPTPPPPMDVAELPKEEVITKTFTLKEQLAEHRDNPNCKSCHKKIDPLGFVLENYDTVGRWRDKYLSDSEVDSLSEIDDEPLIGPAGLKKYLMDNKILYIRNLSKKLLSYALGRGIYFHDNFIVNKMVENAIRNDYSFSSLVKTIVTSPQFQHK
ncbi:MAG: DUF1592 domain-containing protein [Lentisphaeraceae bacterium]|nr:DUF1592 domain-containing protein [Lentisphaeraceae bacterium]